MTIQLIRPLSPHLTIYRPQISSVISILHRMTGVVNFIFLLLFTWWVVSVAFTTSDITQSLAFRFFSSWIGEIVMIGFSFSLFFHFCTGIRHLLWDCGIGFEIKTMTITGWLAVGLSIMLTALTWLIIFNCV